MAGRYHTDNIDPIFKTTGYESWDRDAPPLLRGPLKAWWLRGCMTLYDTRRLGSTGGPRIVNALHRLHLFPVGLPGSN
jgi:hypothetical protein